MARRGMGEATEAKGGDAEESAPTKSKGFDWSRVNWPMLVGSLLLLVGFFLRWVHVDIAEGESAPLAGFEIGGELGTETAAAYYALFALPALALVLIFLAVRAPAAATYVGTSVGAILIAWAVFEVARFLYAQTFLGLWLSVAGAAVLLLAGLLTWRRHRKDAKVKKVVDAQLEKRAKKG